MQFPGASGSDGLDFSPWLDVMRVAAWALTFLLSSVSCEV